MHLSAHRVKNDDFTNHGPGFPLPEPLFILNFAYLILFYLLAKPSTTFFIPLHHTPHATSFLLYIYYIYIYIYLTLTTLLQYLHNTFYLPHTSKKSPPNKTSRNQKNLKKKKKKTLLDEIKTVHSFVNAFLDRRPGGG